MRARTWSLVTLALLACGRGDPPPLAVGAEEGPLGHLGGELLAQALEAKGVPVARRFDLGGARAVHEALRAGEIDAAVETTGTALLDVLGAPLERDPARAFETARSGYRRWGLVVLPRLGWNDPWVVVAAARTARPLALDRLEQLGPHALRLRLAVTPDFLARKDGLPGLSSHYGLGFAEQLRVAPDSLAAALADGRADVGTLRALDPRIAKDGLVVLADGLGWFPPYEAAPVVRRAALARHPTARAALEALAGRLPTEAVRRAVVAIANDGARPADQARALLR